MCKIGLSDVDVPKNTGKNGNFKSAENCFLSTLSLFVCFLILIQDRLLIILFKSLLVCDYSAY